MGLDKAFEKQNSSLETNTCKISTFEIVQLFSELVFDILGAGSTKKCARTLSRYCIPFVCFWNEVIWIIELGARASNEVKFFVDTHGTVETNWVMKSGAKRTFC